jgi:hypothetical protein
MPQKPEPTLPFPAPKPVPAPALAPASAPAFPVAEPNAAQQRIPRWLQRAELFLWVLLLVFIAQWLIFAPWTHRLWDQNPWFEQFPALKHILCLGAVRGLVSGLGILNLWIALQDAIGRRDG